MKALPRPDIPPYAWEKISTVDLLLSKSETATNLDAVIHHHIPVFTSQDLEIHYLALTVPFPPKVFKARFCISTWKTVKQAWKKSSKVAREASGPNFPPNS